MGSRLLATLPWVTLSAAILAACGGTNTGTSMGMIPTTGSSNGGSTGTASGSSGAGASGSPTSGTTTATTGSGTTTSGTTTGSTAGSGTPSSGATGGAGTGASGTSTTGASGSSGAAGSGSTTGASSGTTTAPSLAVNPSPGCTNPQPFTAGKTNTWVRQPAGCDQGADETNCQAIPTGSTVPATPTSGSPEWRGWWVWVPSTYDGTKPTHVVWNFAGCDDQDIFNAGNASFNFDTDANANTIMVGLDYDTYTDVPLCYDNRNPNSNDFIFFPWLQAHIESEFCVDTNHEFLTGYSSGGWVMQQMNCKFPTKIRAAAAVTGCEPGTPADPGGGQPTCDATGKQATFYVHDKDDTTNPYACILPGCTRMLKQNGCTVTDCSDPTDTTVTSVYTPPAGVTLPQGAECRQFNGCPTDYPVVFCTTVGLSHSQNDTNWGVDKMFWDWFVNRLN